MREVTAIEAARLTGRSERTIRRWIESGKLPARQVAVNRYAIKTSDLRKYISKEQPDLLAALARIQELEEIQADLLARVEKLEILLTTVPGQRPDRKATGHRPERPKQPTLTLLSELERSPSSGPEEGDLLPEGTLIMAQFARENGISRRTINDWIMQGKVPATVVGEKYYLTPDQQQAVREFMATRKT